LRAAVSRLRAMAVDHPCRSGDEVVTRLLRAFGLCSLAPDEARAQRRGHRGQTHPGRRVAESHPAPIGANTRPARGAVPPLPGAPPVARRRRLPALRRERPAALAREPRQVALLRLQVPVQCHRRDALPSVPPAALEVVRRRAADDPFGAAARGARAGAAARRELQVLLVHDAPDPARAGRRARPGRCRGLGRWRREAQVPPRVRVRAKLAPPPCPRARRVPAGRAAAPGGGAM